VTADLRTERRNQLGFSFSTFEHNLTECLLRLDGDGAKEQVNNLHEYVRNPGNVKWRIRRACKRALLDIEQELRQGRKDARQVLNMVRQLLEPHMFDALLVRLSPTPLSPSFQKFLLCLWYE
jgi:uncharacterized membrane-anchored protein YjiN (DUF445 family)